MVSKDNSVRKPTSTVHDCYYYIINNEAVWRKQGSIFLSAIHLTSWNSTQHSSLLSSQESNKLTFDPELSEVGYTFPVTSHYCWVLCGKSPEAVCLWYGSLVFNIGINAILLSCPIFSTLRLSVTFEAHRFYIFLKTQIFILLSIIPLLQNFNSVHLNKNKVQTSQSDAQCLIIWWPRLPALDLHHIPSLHPFTLAASVPLTIDGRGAAHSAGPLYSCPAMRHHLSTPKSKLGSSKNLS